MTINFINPADDINLIRFYCAIGESVCLIQHLEEALSHSITIRKVEAGYYNLAKGMEVLNEHRQFTLGKAIKLAIREKIYTETLHKELQDFVLDRNWLIHKCVAENIDDMKTTTGTENLINRIKMIGQKAHSLQRAVEDDMISYCSSQGTDMSSVSTVIENL